MSRGLDPTLNTALEQAAIRPVWIIRLDIVDDPVQVWTGKGDLVVTGSGDTALDGYTFTGMGNIGDIGAMQDTDKGSDSLKLKLPGVQTDEYLLQQVIAIPKVWQFRQAWVWFGLLDSTNNIVINPFRVKTGRLDHMVLSEDGETGTISVVIESHQAFISRALGTAYSEQKEIDPTDTSQDYIHDLANKQPGIGDKAIYSDSGGGCVADDMWLNESIQARRSLKGDLIDLLDETLFGATGNDYSQHTIEEVTHSVQPCFEIETSGGAVLVCSESTPLTLRDGRMILVGECLGEKLATVIDGVFEWQPVVRIEKMTHRSVAHIHVGGRTFAAGKSSNSRIFTHNMAKMRDFDDNVSFERF